MNKKIFSVIFVIVLLSGAGLAAENDVEEDDITVFQNILNLIIGNQRVDLEIEVNETENIVKGFETDGFNITDQSEEGYEEPTIRVVTDQETLEELDESEDNTTELLKEKYNEDRIEIETRGVFNRIRIAILEWIIND